MKRTSFLAVACSVLAGAAVAQPAQEAARSPFAARREKLLARLPPDSIAVFAANPEPNGGSSASTDPYRQDSDFWYLTGFPEPGAVAVLWPRAPEGRRYSLFVRARNFAEEQWTGWRAGVEGARKEYGADEALPLAELWDRLPALLRGARSLYVGDAGDTALRGRLSAAWRAGDANSIVERPVADAGPLVHQMRLIKDEGEIALLRRAVDLSVLGHRAAMRETRPGRPEYALKAAMVSACLAGGGARMAYAPIVGSGPNSVILHYVRDDRTMNAGEMLVNDTACEYGMYAADVTRSYPVSGRFSPEQKAVYEVVLAAQNAAFEKVKPGTAFRDVHAASVAAVVDGLLKLGLLSGDREELIRTRAFTKFYPHGCSHWLGLDVHDAGSYGIDPGVDRKERYFSARTPLAPGMALTVEPGIYIPEGSTPDRRWWNISVRIEDDVLVTATGMECLSCGAPREIADVEKAIAGGK